MSQPVSSSLKKLRAQFNQSVSLGAFLSYPRDGQSVRCYMHDDQRPSAVYHAADRERPERIYCNACRRLYFAADYVESVLGEPLEDYRRNHPRRENRASTQPRSLPTMETGSLESAKTAFDDVKSWETEGLGPYLARHYKAVPFPDNRQDHKKRPLKSV